MNKPAFVILTASVAFFISCKPSSRKTLSGLEYKVVEQGNSGPVAGTGSTVKLHYVQKLHDTVTASTYGKVPYYKALIPGTIFAYDFFEVLTEGVREGDSIVIISRMDSLLKKGKIAKLPAHVKPEDEFITCIKVLKVFPFDIRNPVKADSLINADKEAERTKADAEQTILGPRRIEEYLRKNNITAPVTPIKTYLQIVAPGTGQQVDSGKTVSLQYKVYNLHGKVIDTNMDTTFHHTEPLQFVAGSEFMVKPVDKTVRMLKKGAHVKIYIPTMLFNNDAAARGAQSPNYDDIVFELIVLDVKDK